MEPMHCLEGSRDCLGNLYSFISFSVHLKKLAIASCHGGDAAVGATPPGGGVMVLLWKP